MDSTELNKKHFSIVFDLWFWMWNKNFKTIGAVHSFFIRTTHFLVRVWFLAFWKFWEKMVHIFPGKNKNHGFCYKQGWELFGSYFSFFPLISAFFRLFWLFSANFGLFRVNWSYFLSGSYFYPKINPK